MKNIRVVHVGKFYPPHMGGIETHVQNLCREIAKSCHVDAIVSNDGRGTTAEMDGDVYVRRVGTKFNFAAAPVCPGLIPAIRRSKPDILHLHLPNPIATMAVLASGYQGPLITTYHSDVVRQKWLGRAFEPFLTAILKRSSRIVCTSEAYLDSSPVLERFRDKCVVIPYGIPPTSIGENDIRQAAAIRQRYGSRLIVTVGRLVYYKGLEYLIEAMRRVHGKLLIIGDGPLRDSLARRIAESGLSDRVELVGEIQNDQLAPYYRAADVFAFPSIARSEAFGIVQLEAMACGLPVVNTNLDSGVPSVSRHNETGFTVPPRDPMKLAEALNTLLADRPLCARFASAARNRVRTEFTAEVMTRRITDLYRDVLAARVTERFREISPAPSMAFVTASQTRRQVR
jgi:glycosyltransferase involved in cell wall biosynthesis